MVIQKYVPDKTNQIQFRELKPSGGGEKKNWRQVSQVAWFAATETSEGILQYRFLTKHELTRHILGQAEGGVAVAI